VTPRGVRVRAWIGGYEPVDRHWGEHRDAWGEHRDAFSPSLGIDSSEDEPPERIWIEFRSGWTPLSRRGDGHGTPLEGATPEEVLESFLDTLQSVMRGRTRGWPLGGASDEWCEPTVEIGSDKIRWWYEHEGERVLELEPLPRALLTGAGE